MRRSNPITTAQIVTIKGRYSREQLPRITARVAREELAKVQAVAPAPYKTFVDGREGAPLESVSPGGTILFRFQRVAQAIDWIYAELLSRSPLGPDKDGHYRDDHFLFINDVQVSVAQGAPLEIPPGATLVFLDDKPYSRKIELGESFQATDGVYELTARDARKQFPSADISFTYRALMSGALVDTTAIVGGSKRGAKVANKSSLRYPAITLRAPA